MQALNLSSNDIIGTILSEFLNLKKIESLYLSCNKLNGKIPPQLVELTTLAVFSVAHNNLIGMAPKRTSQFATFTDRSYEEKPFLCGPLLHKNCMESKDIPMSLPVPDCCEEDYGFLEMDSFEISFPMAYANMVLALALFLCEYGSKYGYESYQDQVGYKCGEKSGIHIIPVFISVDPERDTVEQVINKSFGFDTTIEEA
ncbi:hypothetical protein BC332_28652 [Capsicum chinense]|nr:hypothetical protein BC332_28652 [Capsicum chinense]